MGLTIRNKWKLWKGKNSLVKYFNSIGIFHPDDMSSIILASFHRKLNDKDIDIDKQVNYYKDYWNNIQKERSDNVKKFNSIKVGDTVNVIFSRQKIETDKYSLSFISNMASINDTIHCFIKGVVSEKSQIKTSRLLTIQISSANNCSNSYLGNIPMVIGQKLNYDMTYFYLRHD